LGREQIRAEFVDLDDLAGRLAALAPNREETIVWALTDGVRFYRGSAVPALARLAGFARTASGSSSFRSMTCPGACRSFARAATRRSSGR